MISIRARPRGKRIEYSVCDEYQVEYRLPQKTSGRPFSLRELARFLDSVEHPEAEPEWKQFGFVLSFNQTNLDCGADPETLQNFTSVEADFYPALRRALAMQSIALLTHDLFGWSTGQAAQEIDLCAKVWTENGNRTEFFERMRAGASAFVTTTTFGSQRYTRDHNCLFPCFRLRLA